MKNNTPATHSQTVDSSNTKERLLEAAIDVFGKQGFTGATTRMISKTAKVNISAIPYYFNGKEGLYLAAVEHICKRIQQNFYAIILEIDGRTQDQSLDSNEAMTLLEKLLTNLANFMLGSSEALRFVRIVMREQLDPSPAYGIVFSHIMSPMLTSIAGLISVITGISCPQETRLRALMVMGQVIVFRIGRETMVRLLDLDGYNQKETAEIRQVILEQTRAALTEFSLNLKV